MFINASHDENFKKGKRQNELRKKDIDKIVKTHMQRPEEPIERYARRVSMEEIEKNGYNLKISRYVSTAEDEVQIDLNEVNKNLSSINERIEKKTKEHNEFLKLGLPTL